MNIRSSKHEDLPQLMRIYERARQFMSEHGNGNQWINGYPSEELIASEIEKGHSFVCEDKTGEIVGTFCYIEGIDPTYLKIYDGEWPNDEPYATVHRMASSGKRKGVAETCFQWCFRQCRNIRVDTHHDNIVMRTTTTSSCKTSPRSWDSFAAARSSSPTALPASPTNG